MAQRKLNPELVAFVSGVAKFIDETDQKAALTHARIDISNKDVVVPQPEPSSEQEKGGTV